jgi:hypothetical protein
MYIIREVMHCRPGQVTPLVKKFKALNKALNKLGYSWPMRLLTDTSGERYWTMVAEVEVKSVDEYMEMSKNTMSDASIQKAMKDYHILVDHGRREIFSIEG